jgi:dihydroxyacid dehydratase/phosphogluconate dehydratase
MEEDGNMRLIQDGDIIIIDPNNNSMNLDVSKKELQLRKVKYEAHERVEKCIPMSLKWYAKSNPNPRTGSLAVEF